MNDASDFLSGLSKHLIHVLGHGVGLSKILKGRLSGLCVGVERCLVLLEELLLHGDVVVGDAQDDKTILRLA